MCPYVNMNILNEDMIFLGSGFHSCVREELEIVDAIQSTKQRVSNCIKVS